MNIYWLYREDAGYDEMLACVVIARTGPEARELAAAEACDEGGYVWLSDTTATIRRLGTADPGFTEPIVVCTDVHEA